MTEAMPFLQKKQYYFLTTPAHLQPGFLFVEIALNFHFTKPIVVFGVL